MRLFLQLHLPIAILLKSRSLNKSPERKTVADKMSSKIPLAQLDDRSE